LDGHDRSTSFLDHEQQRALDTLRYIHANPKTAGIRKGYFYGSSMLGLPEPTQLLVSSARTLSIACVSAEA